MKKAYTHYLEGRKWLRVIDCTTGDEWDEPITGWCLSINLSTGETVWKHKDGRIYSDFVV